MHTQHEISKSLAFVDAQNRYRNEDIAHRILADALIKKLYAQLEREGVEPVTCEVVGDAAYDGKREATAICDNNVPVTATWYHVRTTDQGAYDEEFWLAEADTEVGFHFTERLD
jgi:hypothetical protein